MNLQPLYDVKERLEYAAIAGVALLGEDFRLQRAVEALKPLAAASPVFGKIDAGVTKLLSAPPEQRPGLLLDVLALVDAVAYTQAKTGAEGELEPLSAGGGVYRQISYGQISPLLTALTATGGGRMEVIQSAWENHPEFFEDYRVLPAVIAGLGDSYGEIATLNAGLLKKIGPSVIPLLKKDFDPAGLKAMTHRVEVISELEGREATPWLREILPQAKKGVRGAVIRALAVDEANVDLLLDLSKSERAGANREAVLYALAGQEGEKVSAFWEQELEKNTQAILCLKSARADWASDLVARGLWDRLEAAVDQGGRVDKETYADISAWLDSALGKSSPSMLDFWRWADGRMEAIDQLKNHTGQPLRLGTQIAGQLMNSLCHAGPGPLAELCLELWGRHPKETRYLSHAVAAALMTRSASEVYDTFSPYVLTIKPLLGGEQKKAFHNAVLRALGRVRKKEDGTYCIDNVWPTAQPLDRRWIKRLTHAVWRTTGQRTGTGYGGNIEEYDKILLRLLDPDDAESRRFVVDHLREQVAAGCCMYDYCREIFRLGGHPVGVLGPAMQRHSGTIYLSHVLDLLTRAQEHLPPAQVVQMAKELFVVNAYQPGNQEMVKKTYPRVIAAVGAGEAVPSFEELRRMVLNGGK